MPLRVSLLHTTDGFEIWHFRAFSRGDKTFCFSVRSCRLHHDVQRTLLHSPLHVTLHVHILSSKYDTRESGIEQVPIYTSRMKKLKRKEFINHKIAKNGYVTAIWFRVDGKNTFRTWKATEMFKYIFVMTVMVFLIYVLHNVNMICIFKWNMISPLHFYVKHDFLLFSVNVKLSNFS